MGIEHAKGVSHKGNDMRGWTRWLLLAMAGVTCLLLALLYTRSTDVLERQYTAETRSLPVSSRPEVVAEGERLARAFGCYRGCHGRTMQGAVLEQGPLLGRVVAPNLTTAIDRYSLSEFEAIVRQGVKPDGTSVFHMPSTSFASMTDPDFMAIASFIRDYTIQVDHQPPAEFGLLARIRLLSGTLRAEAALRHDRPWSPGFEADPPRLGEYLARNACAECHGRELRGGPAGEPSLDIVRRYDRWEFTRFMQTGLAFGERDLGAKSQLMKQRYSGFTEDEIEALYAFLRNR